MWKRLLGLTLALLAFPASAALTSYPNLASGIRNQLQNVSLFVKGNADNSLYLLEVDPATGALPVTGSVTANNPSVSATGAAVPASATYAGYNVAGNLVGMTGTANGLKVDVQTSVLPTGAATETTLAAASAKLPATLGQKAMTASLAVALASDQTAIPVSESGTWNITNVSGTVSLPTGAATLTAQGTGNSSLSSIDGKTPALGQALMASSSPVVIASNQSAVPVSGTVTATVSGTVAVSNLPTTADTNVGAASSSTLRTVAAGRSLTTVVATYAYSGGAVTTAAYTQVVASTGAAITRLHVFDSSGSAIIIATGAAASEVDRIYLPPGGSPFPYEVTIPASTRIAIKALDTTTGTTGSFIITGLQ